MPAAHYPGRVQHNGWVVGRVVGAPVVVELSTVVGALILAAVFYPGAAGLGPGAVFVAVAFVVFLFASILLHELAHGLVGRALGHRPRAFTLTLWGGHTTFQDEPATPGRAALVAAAGPTTNLLVGAAFLSGLTLLADHPLAAWVVFYAAWINLVLGVFNLIPGLPLDGGRVLEALVWKATGRRSTGTFAAGWAGRVVAVGIVVVALGLPYLHGDRPRIWSVLWVLIIAWMLWTGATAALRYVRHTAALGTLSLDTIGHRAVGVVADTTLEQADHAQRNAGAQVVVVLDDDGHPHAIVDPKAAASVPGQLSAITPVSAVTVPVPEHAVVDARTSGAELVAAFAHAKASVLVLTDAGRVVGVITAAALSQAMAGGRAA